jgi:methyltransferase (TIGR00027 family)
VIELDHPATQDYKRERLGELGLGVPESVELAAVDLERTSVGAALAATSFDPGRPAFFSWMGVVVYLTRPAFDATLADVAEAGAPGSRFLFDYPVPPALLREEDLAFSQAIAEGSAGLGESRKLKLMPDEVADAARRAGFEPLEDLSPDDHFARYFAGRGDALAPCPEVHLTLLRRHHDSE